MASLMWNAGGRSRSGLIVSAAKAANYVNQRPLVILRCIIRTPSLSHQQHNQQRMMSSKNSTSATKSAGKGPVGGEKQKKKAVGESTRGQTVEILQKFIDTAERAKAIDLGFSEVVMAEHARIGLEYNRQTTIRENKQGSDLSTKIWLQQEAMRALPPELRAHAEIIDETPPPSDRPWPIWMTPPIKGFNPRNYMGNKGDDDDEDEEDTRRPKKDVKPAQVVTAKLDTVDAGASAPSPAEVATTATTTVPPKKNAKTPSKKEEV